MKQNVLVFDLDGTIADSIVATRKIFKQLAREFNFDQPGIDEFEIYMQKGARKAINALGIPINKLPAIMNKYRLESGKVIETLKPIKGLRQVLTKLKKNGFTLGILTSNTKDNVNKFLDNNNLNFFEFIYSQGGLFGKDKLIKTMLKNLKLAPTEVIYIADETRDIEAAKKMGIEVVAVAWGYNSTDALKKENPNYLLSKPKELIKLFL